MLPRLKKIKKIIDPHFNQVQFLEEHNRLSPINLRTTISLLSRFKVEKASLFKDDNWSVDRLRKPLISWLLSSDLEKKHKIV